MTQAQIAREKRGAASALLLRVVGFLTAIRERGRQRRALVRLLSQLDTGLASGARV